MKKIGLCLELCLCLCVFASVGRAAPITFTGVLSGANENPSTGSPGTGSTVVTFDPVTQLLTVNVSFSGLEANTIAAHIHCCIAPNGIAGVATTSPTFPGFPLCVTSGTYANVFDLTMASSYNPAFVTANGGLAGAEAALVAGLENRMTYLNIHTTMFPGGEIRAFLDPVPEPASAALLAAAAGALWAMRRRIRR